MSNMKPQNRDLNLTTQQTKSDYKDYVVKNLKTFLFCFCFLLLITFSQHFSKHFSVKVTREITLL